MASSPPEEYKQWRLSCTQQQQRHDDNQDKWKHSVATPQTQNSTPPNTTTSDGNNDSMMRMDDGYRQQQQEPSPYWTTPLVQEEEERCYRLDFLSLETTPLTCNRPKHEIITTSSCSSVLFPKDFCSPVVMNVQEAAMMLSPTSPSPPSLDHHRVVMRDATNTSVEVVESRALFPDSSDEDDAALKQQQPYSRQHQVDGENHDGKMEQTTTTVGTTYTSVMKNGLQFRRMKSQRPTKNSLDHHHHHHHHLLADNMVVASSESSWNKVSSLSNHHYQTRMLPRVSSSGCRLDQQAQQHHHHNNRGGSNSSNIHPLLYHERNPSVDSSLSTLSSLDDGTCDGSAQTSPHPYRRPLSSVLVVSAAAAARSNSVFRRSSTAALNVATTDSHSLPPPKYNEKRYNNNNNHHHFDLNHPATATTFGDAAAAADNNNGAAAVSSSPRGGNNTRSTSTSSSSTAISKSLLRLAVTNNGLLWIMCFMALTSICMTVFTSRMLKSLHEQQPHFFTTLARPGGVASGSVLFPPTASVNKQSVLIPLNNQHTIHQQQALRQASTVVEKAKKSRYFTDAKQGKPEQQKPVPTAAANHHHRKKATTTKKRRRAQEKIKQKTQAKSTTKIQSTFELKPVQLPIGTIAEKRKEPIDHKIYRTNSRQSFNKEGTAVQEQLHRRIIYMHESLEHQKPKPRKIAQYPADFTDSTQLYSVLDSGDERVRKSMELRAPYVQGECVPMQDWQTTFHPSCNHVHALSLDRMGESDSDGFELFGTKGFWRNAWKVQFKSNGQDRSKNNTINNGSEEDVIVLKTLKIQHQFEDAHFEHNRIDAVAMERLTSSPHVINIFGFCGHSVMTEYADGNRLGALADKSRSTPLARLRIARDIATGLADVHGIDGDGNTTFVHLDVNPANIVSIGGTLKLNDFNIGIIRRWNTTSNEPCGFPTQYPNPQWRSPEEARNELDLTEKVDVFSMGHIFFRLICGHEPWNKLEPGGKPSKTEMNEKVKQGILPTIPASVLHSTDKEVVAIREAMLQCYKFNPKERPNARRIANALQGALDKLERKQ